MRWWITTLIGLATGVNVCCVGNVAYRRGHSVLNEQLLTGEFDRTQNPSEWSRPWRYRLAFVEFDDRGELFDRDELTAALGAIAQAKAEEVNAGGPAVVALFVHGWKNNAADSSGNVWGFRQLLAGLSEQYATPVVGIYVGWRGAVLNAPILEDFTFFDRHAKSQNLPGAHMVETLLKIMQAAKGPRYTDPTISVLVGHSFGGAVLESALTQSLEDMIEARPAGGDVQWPANLIVFLNEAQEATRSYQLVESLMANVTPRDPCQPPGVRQDMPGPAIVSMSSTGDYATRAAFPAGQIFARPFNSLRHYDAPNALGFSSQTPMFFNTTAHLDEFRSHLMDRADDPDIAAAMKSCKPYLTTTLGGTEYVLVEKPNARNRTPYWVMHIPTAIVPDHSTIFTTVYRNLLITLLLARSY